MKKVFGLMMAVLFVAATSFAQTPATTTTQEVKKEAKKADAATRKAYVAKRDSLAAKQQEAKKTYAVKRDSLAVKREAKKAEAVKKTGDAATKAKVGATSTTQHLKSDGTPDKRFNENKVAPKHLKKDGTLDKRYKENKKDSIK